VSDEYCEFLQVMQQAYNPLPHMGLSQSVVKLLQASYRLFNLHAGLQHFSDRLRFVFEGSRPVTAVGAKSSLLRTPELNSHNPQHLEFLVAVFKDATGL
jgi:hypothetical protein